MTAETIAPTPSAGEPAASIGRWTDAGVGNDVDVSAHLPVVLVGLRWLFDTEQPAGAVQCPAGDRLPSQSGRGFRFIPSGPGGAAAVGIAVTTGISGDEIGGHELAEFIDLLEGMGEEVVAIDAIAERSFCTLTLARAAHPTLSRAVARYRAGHLLHANASPFGPARRPDLVAAVSAADLYRQMRDENASVEAPAFSSKPFIYWIDLFRCSTTAPTAAKSTERQLALRS